MSIDAAAPGLAMTVFDVPPEASVARTPADFESFYDAHVDFAWRVARRLGVSADRLDDVTQDVFFVVHRRLGELDPHIPPRAWLFRVVQNVVYEHHRRERRRSFEPLPDEVPCAEDDPERVTSRGEDIALVDRLVRAIPQERRAVFVLAECEQMTAPEIATALGVNLNTVYTRLRLARADFEAALARHRRTLR